jgi:carboxyl-terminal processing protease
MDESEKKRAGNDKLGNTILDKEGKPVTNSLNVSDEYLREGLFVLSNMIASKIG